MTDEPEDNSNLPLPLFLDPERAEAEGAVPKSEDESWGDYLFSPFKPLSPRHKRAAEMFVEGKTNTEVANYLNYSANHVCIMKSQSKFIAFMEELRDRLFDYTVAERLDTFGPAACDNIEELLKDPKTNAKQRESISRWVIEMKTGKASQKIDVTGEINVGMFMDKLDRMKNVYPTSETSKPKVIEGEAQPSETTQVPHDPYADWLDKET